MQPSTRPRASTLLAIAVALAVGWWSWPALRSLAGGDRPGAVLILDDGYLSDHLRAVGDRLREDGRDVEWSAAASWCDGADELGSRAAQNPAPSPTDVVVVSLGVLGSCGDGIDALLAAALSSGVRDVVIVPQVGVHDAAVGAALDGLAASRAQGIDGRVVVADTTVLLGGSGTREMACEWWDGCEGFVQVRLANGLLSGAGAGRVSRLVVELLR
ncbi:MAG: hypothetical protein ACKOYG_02035 [Ilumatobacteraceae bacterium]